MSASQKPGPAVGPSSRSVPASSPASAGDALASLRGRALELVGDWAPADADDPRRDAAVPVAGERILADRLAAALVHHEPGWRLPRASTLARRYAVDVSQVDRAIDDLIHRRLVRRLPNGQLYRASPAEYLLALEGVPGLASQVDPMGEEITCHSRHILRRPCPEDVGQALGIRAGEPVSVVRVMWAAGGQPAGLTTSYLTDPDPGRAVPADSEAADANTISPLTPPTDYVTADANADSALRPSGLIIEMQLPPPSVARSLRLSAGEPATLIIVRFSPPGQHRPAALTIAALRPDKFRILIQSPVAPRAAGRTSCP